MYTDLDVYIIHSTLDNIMSYFKSIMLEDVQKKETELAITQQVMSILETMNKKEQLQYSLADIDDCMFKSMIRESLNYLQNYSH